MSQYDRVFKALGDPLRLKILNFLCNPEAACCVIEGCICACDLEKISGVSQATVSHHMKLLIDAGLVRAVKRGRWMTYALEQQAFTELQAFLAGFANKNCCTEQAAAG